MNLVKNVEGDWAQSKLKVRQDLDTIQRTINQLIAQVTAIQAAVPTPPAVISSANTVTTFDDNFLRSVATVPLSGLTGKGTITDPLGFGGALSVDVNPAGALDGNGTSGSPLAVRVDGVTITIDGSNQLVAAGGGGVAIQRATVTVANPAGKTLFSAPVQLLAGIGGSIILPLSVYLHCSQPATYFFSRNADIAYDVTPSTPVADSAVGPLAGLQTNAAQDVVKVFGPNAISSGALTTLTSKGLWLQSGADNNIGGFDPGDVNFITFDIFYIVL